MEVKCYQVVDGHGNSTNGLTYRNRIEALKYALQENGRYIKEVIIEIGLDGNPK